MINCQLDHQSHERDEAGTKYRQGLRKDTIERVVAEVESRRRRSSSSNISK